MANIHDVAKEAGVSSRTAARILAGDSPKSTSRETVIAAAKKLGYVRSQQAANFRKGRSQFIGLIVPYIDNPFYTSYLQHFHDALKVKDYQSFISCSFGRSSEVVNNLNMFEVYNVDGLILDISEGGYGENVFDKLHEFQKRGNPVVVTGGQQKSIPYDNLYLDNRAAIRKAVYHLVDRGKRKIAFLGGPENNFNIHNRLEGYRFVLKKRKLPVKREWISLGSSVVEGVRERVRELLELQNKPDAIICTSDIIAMIALKEVSLYGLKIPKDIAITGFDDILQADLLNPALTTLHQPIRRMARAAVDLLISRIKNTDQPLRIRNFKAELVIRETT